VWSPESKESVRVWTLEQSKKKMEGDTFHWIIENNESQAVGSINTHDCDHRNGTFMYGIDIDANHRRKGYASESIRLVLSYYFGELRYQKVTTPVHSNNQISINLHEKLGFKREGVLRRMIYSAGEYHDMVWFGMTIEEFKDNRKD
jgi:RimJ/RimL family protein N-acetyltransferase